MGIKGNFQAEAARASVWSENNLVTSGQRVRQRGAVDHLQLTADRHAVGDAAGVNAVLRAQFGDVVGGCLPFHRGVGGEDHLFDGFRLRALLQTIETDIVRADAVQRERCPISTK